MTDSPELNKLIKFLTSYMCTLSFKDQKILKKIYSLDIKMDNFLKYHPFFWGQAAVTYYSDFSDSSSNIFKTPNLNQVLGQYDKTKLNQTILEFPVDLSLSPLADYHDCKILYDPRFILTSLYHLLSPDNLINCYKFITLNGLSLTLMATSSHDKMMRSLAYSILSRYYRHLELVKNFRGSNLWLIFLDYIRSSIYKKNQQLPFLKASFLVLTINIFTHPIDPLFPHLRDMIISKPNLDSNLISKLCLNLLNSNDVQNWQCFQKVILKFLSNSVKFESDFQILQKHDFYKALIILYNSNFCLIESKLLILKLIYNIVQIPYAFKKIVIEHAFIVWLNSISLELNKNENGENQAKLIADIANYILDNYVNNLNQPTFYPTFYMEVAIWISSLDKDSNFKGKIIIDQNMKV